VITGEGKRVRAMTNRGGKKKEEESVGRTGEKPGRSWNAKKRRGRKPRKEKRNLRARRNEMPSM